MGFYHKPKHIINHHHHNCSTLVLDIYLRSRQGSIQVLLVSQNQYGDPLVFGQAGDPVQLHLGLLHAFRLGGVHHKHQAVRPACVRLPQRPQLVLATHVPHLERRAVGLGVAHGHLDPLHVEALGGDGLNELPQLEAVEERRLAGAVQTDHHHVQGLEARQEGGVRGHVGQLVAHVVPKPLAVLSRPFDGGREETRLGAVYASGSTSKVGAGKGHWLRLLMTWEQDGK